MNFPNKTSITTGYNEVRNGNARIYVNAEIIFVFGQVCMYQTCCLKTSENDIYARFTDKHKNYIPLSIFDLVNNNISDPTNHKQFHTIYNPVDAFFFYQLCSIFIQFVSISWIQTQSN